MTMLEQMADEMIQGAAKRLGGTNSYAKASAALKIEFLASAQDALTALLKPSGEVIQAGVDAMGRNNLWDGWPAMICAIKAGK